MYIFHFFSHLKTLVHEARFQTDFENRLPILMTCLILFSLLKKYQSIIVKPIFIVSWIMA